MFVTGSLFASVLVLSTDLVSLSENIARTLCVQCRGSFTEVSREGHRWSRHSQLCTYYMRLIYSVV